MYNKMKNVSCKFPSECKTKISPNLLSILGNSNGFTHI